MRKVWLAVSYLLLKLQSSSCELSRSSSFAELGQVEPKWGNHSLRRHADGVAQEALRLGLIPNVSKQLIDFFFGWLLKELSRDMQVHYAGLDRPARRLLAQVTMML